MHPDFPFLLLWSHKAASSVLAHWFFAQIGSPHLAGDSVARAEEYRGPRIHRYQFDVYNRQPGYLGDCVRALRAGRPAIRFVRDPAARAYSGFLSARRRAALNRTEFWGAGVRAALLEALFPGAEPDRAFSFADFVEWLGRAAPESLDNHVRPQVLGFESGHRIEYLPIEDLLARLQALERRYALPGLAAQPGLLDSPHHREKAADLYGGALEQELRRPVAIGELERRTPPAVDTARLAGTALGARIREVLAADYAAAPLY